MTPREQRGLVIAAMCRLNRAEDGTWLVPSQSSTELIYRVNLETKSCNCKDCVEGGFTCKHYYAAIFVNKREVLADGTMIETKTFSLTDREKGLQARLAGLQPRPVHGEASFLGIAF